MTGGALTRDIVVSLGAAVTAVAALLGLYRWFHELRVRARMDIARRLVVSSSRFCGLFKDTRLDGDWEERKSAVQWLKPLRREYVQLLEGGWEAELFFDEGITRRVNSIAERYRKLHDAMDEHLFDKSQRSEHPELKRGEEDIKRGDYFTRWLYCGGPDDEKNKELEKDVLELKKKLKAGIGIRRDRVRKDNLRGGIQSSPANQDC